MTLCRVMCVSRSGFYDWCKREGDDPGRRRLREVVKAIHTSKRGSCGSRGMSKALRRRGEDVGRHMARSLMREAGLECRQRRRRRQTTDSDHQRPTAPNRLERQFDPGGPDEIWVADLTAVWTVAGWLYLAVVMDLYDRQIIGWSMAEHMRTELAVGALEMALGRRQPAPGAIHHSDRGSQYAAHEYARQLEEAGMLASMSRKGSCLDNAVIERFFGSLKAEWLDGQRYETREEARADIVEYIEMHYNSDRAHSTLGDLTPREMQLAAAA